jgi:hypothetical protein
VHPKVVQYLLGHASINTTLGPYSHRIPSMGRTTSRKMDDALEGEEATTASMGLGPRLVRKPGGFLERAAGRVSYLWGQPGLSRRLPPPILVAPRAPRAFALVDRELHVVVLPPLVLPFSGLRLSRC